MRQTAMHKHTYRDIEVTIHGIRTWMGIVVSYGCSHHFEMKIIVSLLLVCVSLVGHISSFAQYDREYPLLCRRTTCSTLGQVDIVETLPSFVYLFSLAAVIHCVCSVEQDRKMYSCIYEELENMDKIRRQWWLSRSSVRQQQCYSLPIKTSFFLLSLICWKSFWIFRWYSHFPRVHSTISAWFFRTCWKVCNLLRTENRIQKRMNEWTVHSREDFWFVGQNLKFTIIAYCQQCAATITRLSVKPSKKFHCILAHTEDETHSNQCLPA